MNLAKNFTPNQSIYILIGISVLLISLFFIFQSSAKNLEEESVKREVEINKRTQRLLFDLKQTLNSGVEKDAITSKSLSIISEIRNTLDSEIVFLRIEAQEKIAIIHTRINEVERTITEGDFEEAERLVDNLISELERSNDIGSFGESENENISTDEQENNYNPNFENSQDESSSTETNNLFPKDSPDTIPENSLPNEIESETDVSNNNEDDDEYFYKGTTPSWDRNRFAEQENILELKIGN